MAKVTTPLYLDVDARIYFGKNVKEGYGFAGTISKAGLTTVRVNTDDGAHQISLNTFIGAAGSGGPSLEPPTAQTSALLGADSPAFATKRWALLEYVLNFYPKPKDEGKSEKKAPPKISINTKPKNGEKFAAYAARMKKAASKAGLSVNSSRFSSGTVEGLDSYMKGRIADANGKNTKEASITIATGPVLDVRNPADDSGAEQLFGGTKGGAGVTLQGKGEYAWNDGRWGVGFLVNAALTTSVAKITGGFGKSGMTFGTGGLLALGGDFHATLGKYFQLGGTFYFFDAFNSSENKKDNKPKSIGGGGGGYAKLVFKQDVKVEKEPAKGAKKPTKPEFETLQREFELGLYGGGGEKNGLELGLPIPDKRVTHSRGGKFAFSFKDPTGWNLALEASLAEMVTIAHELSSTGDTDPEGNPITKEIERKNESISGEAFVQVGYQQTYFKLGYLRLMGENTGYFLFGGKL